MTRRIHQRTGGVMIAPRGQTTYWTTLRRLALGQNKACSSILNHWRALLIGLAVVAMMIIAAVWVRWSWICWNRKVEIETEAIGLTLLIFIEDHGRMPDDMQELYAKGYLDRGPDGFPRPGAAVKGRGSKWGWSPSDVHFQYLDHIAIGFRTGRPGAPPLEVRDSEAAQACARRFSGLIRVTLEEASTRPARVRPATPSPPTVPATASKESLPHG